MDLGWVLANLVVLIAACIQAISGIGFALIAIPLLAVIDIRYVPGPSLLVMFFLTVFMFLTGHRHVVSVEVKKLMPSLFLGVFVGAVILNYLPTNWLHVLFSLFLIAALLMTIYLQSLGISKSTLIAGGFFSGLMGTISGIPGPPLIVVYQKEKLEKIRATIALMLSIVSSISIISLVLINKFEMMHVKMGLGLLPGITLGYLVSRKIIFSIPNYIIRIFMVIVTSISVVVILVRALI